MSLQQVLPKIFYEEIETGLAFFVDAMGFRLSYSDDTLYIVTRDEITLLLVANAEYAQKDRPEIRIATDDIHAIYEEIKTRSPHILHPNGNTVVHKPWGLLEFAVLDPTTVCVIFQQEA
ncbi:hypothetical protein SAMN05421788_107137 [Filimonas lacunae]|uniref:VOC domain-containing protein n=1 Tax=Filimonas lacunae TaxID=477680 RepID=A0A173MFV7_9BACT|nr:hypothetical protein [Filimonas lacunae]BAV06475.1 hypothetical protein FLA_2494 [Filimonas lacunae]SIT27096.1 hypothetical protein SAMN05421788_107137 [Filimonas lacunae]